MCLKRSFKCLTSCIIVCVVLLLTLVITAVVLMNLTPNKLGFGNKDIFDDTSLAEMGLADLKIKDLTKGMLNLRKFEESDVIKNPFNSNNEASIAKDNIKNSNINGNNVNFSSVITNKVVYDNVYMLTYQDTTLAFILNAGLNTFSQNGSNTLSLYGIQVREVSITNNSTPHAKIVFTFPNFKSKTFIDSKVFKDFANSPVIALDFDFTVSSDGFVAIAQNSKNSSLSCVINNNNKMITTYFNYLFDSQTEGGINAINEIISESFINIINNLGQVGNASTLENKVVQCTPSFGSGAISNGIISLITYNE